MEQAVCERTRGDMAGWWIIWWESNQIWTPEWVSECLRCICAAKKWWWCSRGWYFGNSFAPFTFSLTALHILIPLPVCVSVTQSVLWCMVYYRKGAVGIDRICFVSPLQCLGSIWTCLSTIITMWEMLTNETDRKEAARLRVVCCDEALMSYKLQ